MIPIYTNKLNERMTYIAKLYPEEFILEVYLLVGNYTYLICGQMLEEEDNYWLDTYNTDNYYFNKETSISILSYLIKNKLLKIIHEQDLSDVNMLTIIGETRSQLNKTVKLLNLG